MKDKQEQIFYMAGGSKEKVEKFVERLFLTEAVDEYAMQFLLYLNSRAKNSKTVTAKEGFNIDGDTDAAKARRDAVKEMFDPLLKWLHTKHSLQSTPEDADFATKSSTLDEYGISQTEPTALTHKMDKDLVLGPGL